VLHWQASNSRQPFKFPTLHRDKSVYASEPMAPRQYPSQAKARLSPTSARRSGSYQDLTRIGSERASKRDRGRGRDRQQTQMHTHYLSISPSSHTHKQTSYAPDSTCARIRYSSLRLPTHMQRCSLQAYLNIMASEYHGPRQYTRWHTRSFSLPSPARSARDTHSLQPREALSQAAGRPR
jgi:hypothetical protein